MRPLPPPSLEVITDRRDRRLVVLMSTPEAVVTEARYGPGQPGANPHVHRRHADLFHVVEGGLEFLLGPNHAWHRLGPGQTVIAPPGVIHGFQLPAADSYGRTYKFDVMPGIYYNYISVNYPGLVVKKYDSVHVGASGFRIKYVTLP